MKWPDIFKNHPQWCLRSMPQGKTTLIVFTNKKMNNKEKKINNSANDGPILHKHNEKLFRDQFKIPEDHVHACVNVLSHTNIYNSTSRRILDYNRYKILSTKNLSRQNLPSTDHAFYKLFD